MNANSQQDPLDGDFNVIGGEIFASFSPWASWLGDGNPFAPTAIPSLSTQAGGSAALGDPGSFVAVTSGGITINLIFSAAALAAPAGFRAGIQQAVGILAAAISDPITVNIKIDYSGTGGGASAGPDHGLLESYSAIRADLINNATPGDTTFNALTAGSSIQGQTGVAVWNAQLKLWGLIAPNDTTTDDGAATFATDINPNLLVGVALHELTHAMGRIPYGPSPDIFDLFRFTGAGTRLFQGGATAPAAYFSLDGGNTKVADYGRTSDASDFLNSGVQGPNDPFNEFYGGGTSQQLTATDLKQLDALGFHLRGTGAGGNHAPVLTVAPNISANPGQTLQASSLFSATDADNDALTYYFEDDSAAANSGHFVVNGTVVPAGTSFGVSAAQLAQTVFVAGAAGTSDNLVMQVTDGRAVSSLVQFHVNVNHAPVVTVADVAAGPGQTLQASNLFSATDADNDALIYYFEDLTSDYVDDFTAAVTSGHFVVNGTVIAAGTSFSVSGAQLAQTVFVAGAAGASDDLLVQVTDGRANSNLGEFHVTVGPNHAPVVTVASANVPAAAGQTFAASSLFSVTDAENDPLTYFLYDGSPAANSGHFVVNGTTIAAQTVVALSAAQVAHTTFVAGAGGSSDDLSVMAYDGQAYSGNTSFTPFHVTVGPNHAPVVTVASANVPAAAGQTFAASSLFSVTDAENDPLTYFLYDGSPAANSGHFVVNGTTIAAQTVVALSAGQVAQATFVAGAGGSSDDLSVMAYDGQAYSGNTSFTPFHVTVGPNHAPVVTVASANVPAAAGQTFAASSLFSVTDAENDPLTYFLYDGSPAANSGHFVVNGTTIAAQTVVALSAGQVAQTTFVAGAGGSSDDLSVMVYDGQAYSGNTSFTPFHVNVQNPAAPLAQADNNIHLDLNASGFVFSSIVGPGGDQNNGQIDLSPAHLHESAGAGGPGLIDSAAHAGTDIVLFDDPFHTLHALTHLPDYFIV